MDREKVINALRQCVGYEDVDNNYTCIYDGDTNPNCPYGGTGGDGVSCMTKMMRDALALLKAQEPRVMTWDEVKKKINSGVYVFTECEKEGQLVRYGNAKLSVDQGDSCRIAFLSSGSREDNPHAIWWWISYKNYNKTWRCWTIPLTYAQMEAVKWE